MTQLFLNGKEAILSTGTNFKLTRNNPMLVDSGDYTFDVSLPLDGCRQNQDIFGAIHRIETSKINSINSKYGNYTLLADELSIEGTFSITSISEKEIKIQLLGGRSGLNSEFIDEDGNDKYIDELELGKAWDSYFKFYYGPTVEQTMYRTIDMFIHPDKHENMWAEAGSEIANGNPCVAFPIYSGADSAMANPRALNRFYTTNSKEEQVKAGTWNNVALQMSIWNVPFTEKTNNIPTSDSVSGISVKTDLVLAPQPYICHIVERIIEALGYVIKKNAIRESSWMRNVFIANARGTLYLNQILPHWTIKEFFKEIENFFGVMINSQGKEVYIVSKSEYYNASGTTHYLNGVVDEYSSEVDSSDVEEKDLTKANVGYSFPSIPKTLQVPDDVFEKAIIKKFETTAEMNNYTAAIDKDNTTEWKSQIYIDNQTHKKYAWMNVDSSYNLYEIDQMSNLYQHSGRDLDVTLKIVPIQLQNEYTEINNFVKCADKTQYELINTDKESIMHVEMLTDDTRSVTGYDNYSVEDALKGDTDAESTNKRDVIEVGLNSSIDEQFSYTDKYLNQNVVIDTISPVGIPYTLANPKESSVIYWLENTFENFLHFVLTRGSVGKSIASNLSAYSKVESRIEFQFSFVDKGNFLPTDIYYIRGKKYLCEKLELTISEKGKDKLVKGYFFEMN